MEENRLAIQNEISNEEIKNLMYTIRGKQVMLDSDVARLFNMKLKTLIEMIKIKSILIKDWSECYLCHKYKLQI